MLGRLLEIGGPLLVQLIEPGGLFHQLNSAIVVRLDMQVAVTSAVIVIPMGTAVDEEGTWWRTVLLVVVLGVLLHLQ